MAKKVVKKKKLKIKAFLILLLVLTLLFLVGYSSLNKKIENIIITGNTYVEDDEIIKAANILNYPSFYLTFSNKIEKNILKNPYIKSVKVKRGFLRVITIEVKEHKVLFRKKDNNKIVLDNMKELVDNNENGVSLLINYVPNDKYKTFVKKMAQIDSDILQKVSEIEYKPNDFDKDRFLLYMDDSNMVYLTLTKFKMLNYYIEVLPQLEGKKGILYLDSGNHFKIMG